MPSPVFRLLRYAEQHRSVRPAITTVMPGTAKTSDEDRWQRALQHSDRLHGQAQSGQPQRLRHRLLCHALSIPTPARQGPHHQAGSAPPGNLRRARWTAKRGSVTAAAYRSGWTPALAVPGDSLANKTVDGN